MSADPHFFTNKAKRREIKNKNQGASKKVSVMVKNSQQDLE
jgi:hypothetical protein